MERRVTRKRTLEEASANEKRNERSVESEEESQRKRARTQWREERAGKSDSENEKESEVEEEEGGVEKIEVLYRMLKTETEKKGVTRSKEEEQKMRDFAESLKWCDFFLNEKEKDRKKKEEEEKINKKLNELRSEAEKKLEEIKQLYLESRQLEQEISKRGGRLGETPMFCHTCGHPGVTKRTCPNRYYHDEK